MKRAISIAIAITTGVSLIGVYSATIISHIHQETSINLHPLSFIAIHTIFFSTLFITFYQSGNDGAKTGALISLIIVIIGKYTGLM